MLTYEALYHAVVALKASGNIEAANRIEQIRIQRGLEGNEFHPGADLLTDVIDVIIDG